MKVDLITGFLGAGKTTFIQHYIEYLHRHGQKVRIIENEFGAVSVDSQILKEEDCEIHDLTGMCMCCVGKDAFNNMLVEAAMDGCNRVIVEPSGIYDADEFFSVMESDKVKDHCEIGMILTIVDAKWEKGVSGEADYLMLSQLLAAGSVLMSKTQLFSEEEENRTIEQLNCLMEEFGCDRRFGKDVIRTPWDQFDDRDFLHLSMSGWKKSDHKKEYLNHGQIFTTCQIGGYCENLDDLKKRVDSIFSEEKYGTVFRVKGYVRDLEKNWYEVNCSPDIRNMAPCQVKKGILVIIGQGLKELELRKVLISKEEMKQRIEQKAE